MLKRVLVIFLAMIIWGSSIAFAYVIGGSNLGVLGYPEFNSYISYNPSHSEIEQYIWDAKVYVENCNYDIQRIQEAKSNTIDKVNDAVYQYNNNY